MRNILRRSGQFVLMAAVVFLVGLAGVNSYHAAHLRALPIVYAQSLQWPEPPYFPANVSFSASTAQTLVAAPSAGGLCVYSLTLINAGASADTISVYLDGGTTAVASVYLAAGGGSATWPLLNGNSKNPYFLTNAGQGFVVKSGTAVQVNGSVYAANCP